MAVDASFLKFTGHCTPHTVHTTTNPYWKSVWMTSWKLGQYGLMGGLEMLPRY